MKKLLLILFVFLLFAFPLFAQTDIEGLVKNAQELSHQNKFDEAVAEIGKAIAVQPNNPDLYLHRAEYNFLLEKKAAVLEDAQKAATLNPTDKKVLYFSALILHKSRQYQEALKIADALIALGDVDRFGWSLRVQIKTHLEDFIGAFEDATTAAELFPLDNTLKQNQANLIRLMGDSDKALEMYNTLIASLERKFGKIKNEDEKAQAKRDLTSFLFSRAGLNFAKFNNEQAQSDMLKAVNYSPTEFNYLRRAKIYRQQKMYAEAVADLNKALEINKQPEKIMFLIERGDVYYLMQKYAEAIADFEQIIKLDEQQLKEPMQRRIALAKQKMQGNVNEPK